LNDPEKPWFIFCSAILLSFLVMHLVPVAGVDSGNAKIFSTTRSLRSLEAQRTQRKPAVFIEFLCVLCASVVKPLILNQQLE
jgi:hypothetical protein